MAWLKVRSAVNVALPPFWCWHRQGTLYRCLDHGVRLSFFRVRRRCDCSAYPEPTTGCSTSLLFIEVDAILFVFAEHLKDVGIGKKIVGDRDGKRFAVHLGVVEGHFNIQMSEVAASEAFRNAQGFALWVAAHIQGRSIVEARGFDDEDVALQWPAE